MADAQTLSRDVGANKILAIVHLLLMFICQSHSAAVRNPNAQLAGEHPVCAKVLTKDHKPEDPEEHELIHSLGKNWLNTTGLLIVYWLNTTGLLIVYWLNTTGLLIVYWLNTTGLLIVYWLNTTGLLIVHYRDTDSTLIELYHVCYVCCRIPTVT